MTMVFETDTEMFELAPDELAAMRDWVADTLAVNAGFPDMDDLGGGDIVNAVQDCHDGGVIAFLRRL